MGSRGPVPERSGTVLGHHRTVTDQKISRVRIPTKVTQPRADASWHPRVKQLYEALKNSGQSKWFEPSDWAYALFVCDEIDFYIKKNRSAMRLQVLMSGLSNLLVSEADRRRVSMEIDRVPEEDPAVAEARAFYSSGLDSD